MLEFPNFQKKSLFTIATTSLVSLYLLIDYLKGHIPTHYLLANEDLPGFSNWWGLITIPLVTWIVLTLIERRKAILDKKGQLISVGAYYKTLRVRFWSALLFGAIAGALWEFNLPEILEYYILLPFLMSLVVAVYFPECFLGFVLGMLYTFGGVLPILIGTVILIISFLIYQIIGRGIKWLFSRIIT